MNVREIIKEFGGTKAVIAATGLSAQRVTHFRSDNRIPRHWLLVLKLSKPELPWDSLVMSQDGPPQTAHKRKPIQRRHEVAS